MSNEFEPVIGLEVHVQLGTKTKLFCACSSEGFSSPPNTNICPVCTGHPGVLPVTNRKAVELGVQAALALGCRIRAHSTFARKNYFYPDLPKAYQVSQYDEPISEDGKLDLPGGKAVGICRVHLEEDAGKLLHAIGSEELPYSLVDMNRCGVPLIEIVSKPELFSPEEAYLYLVTLKQLLRYLNVSDCDMEKGEMRCDANVSVRPRGSLTLGTRTEVKNLNSFKAVKEALAYEIERQTGVVSRGGEVVQETRLWDEASGTTATMRSKEEAHDYRYFPDPDLVPLVIEESWLEDIRRGLPELPSARRERFVKKYGLSEYDASVLTSSRESADLYEKTLAQYLADNPSLKDDPGARKVIANWTINQHQYAVNEIPLTHEQSQDIERLHKTLAGVVGLVESGMVSPATGKEVLVEAYRSGKDPRAIVKDTGAAQVSDDAQIRIWATEAVSENTKATDDFRKGNERALGALVGAVMKKSKGKANPALVNQVLREILKS